MDPGPHPSLYQQDFHQISNDIFWFTFCFLIMSALLRTHQGHPPSRTQVNQDSFYCVCRIGSNFMSYSFFRDCWPSASTRVSLSEEWKNGSGGAVAGVEERSDCVVSAGAGRSRY